MDTLWNGAEGNLALRNGDLPSLVEMLRTQADVKYDVVVPSSALVAEGGVIGVREGALELDEEGTSLRTAWLDPTPIFDKGIGARFDIPLKYVRAMRARPDLWDMNVNYWLGDEPTRRHLLRGFRTDDCEQRGIARALLSDRYKPVDNLDILLATLDGVREAGVEVNIDGGDLTEANMNLRLVCPGVAEYAPDLLADYRSVHNGRSGNDLPHIFAGLVVKNSETGNGAFTIVPRLVVEVCSNGLQMTKDAVREIHLGGKLADGVVKWSDDTSQKVLELITAKARDAVAAFVDVDYMRSVIADLTELAGVTVVRPVETIQRLGKTCGWSEDEQDNILQHFISGCDTSAFGVAQAVTSYAQVIADGSRADELEVTALNAASMAVAV